MGLHCLSHTNRYATLVEHHQHVLSLGGKAGAWASSRTRGIKTKRIGRLFGLDTKTKTLIRGTSLHRDDGFRRARKFDKCEDIDTSSFKELALIVHKLPIRKDIPPTSDGLRTISICRMRPYIWKISFRCCSVMVGGRLPTKMEQASAPCLIDGAENMRPGLRRFNGVVFWIDIGDWTERPPTRLRMSPGIFGCSRRY